MDVKRAFVTVVILCISTMTTVVLFGTGIDSVVRKHFLQTIQPEATPCPDSRKKPVKKIVKYKYYPNEEPFQPICHNCAFVVGSGHMIDAKKGREIDKNDCILRPNDAPTSGYEPDVGAKTTIRSVDHRSLDFITKRLKSGRPFDDLHENMTFVVFSSQNATNWKKVVKQIKALRTNHPAMKFVIHENDWLNSIQEIFRKEVDNSTGHIWISNGFYSLLLLKEICSNISVYGMSDPNYCFLKGNNDVQYHYYFGYSGLECATFLKHAKAKDYAHRFLSEKTVYEIWRRTWKNLIFRYPVWPLSNSNSNFDDTFTNK